MLTDLEKLVIIREYLEKSFTGKLRNPNESDLNHKARKWAEKFGIPWEYNSRNFNPEEKL